MIKKLTSKSLAFSIVFMASAAFFFGCGQSLRAAQLFSAKYENLLPQAEKIIDLALSDTDPRIRANAVEVIASTKKVEYYPRMTAMLKDPIVPVRFAAAVAIGDTGYSQTKEIIKKLLEDPDHNVRIAAGFALAKFGSSEGFNILGQAIIDKDQTVRANATQLLGKTGDTRALKPLNWVLKDADSDDKVRFQAVEAMARLGDESVFTKLWAMLISTYADDRAMGVRGMGALGTRKAKDVLYTVLDDDVAEVRLIAAEQLGMLGDTVGAPQVLEILQGKLPPHLDEEGIERIRVLAALATGEIATSDLTDFLPKLLADNSKFVRLAAAKAVFNCVNSQKR
ncbi:MAG: HEAT repeat domain-containing protein [Phycisphaerae bacterium]|nr:HEAT repeat domain-containing protein [Phycisphaerae bacterium]